MDKRWKKFERMTEECYEGIYSSDSDIKTWEKTFSLLVDIIVDLKAEKPEVTEMLDELEDYTDYRYDISGWLEDYLDQLEAQERYETMEISCKKLLELFPGEEIWHGDWKAYLMEGYNGQGKHQESIAYGRNWCEEEERNPQAHAALIYALISSEDFVGAEALVKRHIDSETLCDEDNELIFYAAAALYQKNGNQKEAERIGGLLEEFNKRTEEELEQMVDSEMEFEDDALPFF